jgi:hypothetical protein
MMGYSLLFSIDDGDTKYQLPTMAAKKTLQAVVFSYEW